jgi:hypothetical protein
VIALRASGVCELCCACVHASCVCLDWLVCLARASCGEAVRGHCDLLEAVMSCAFVHVVCAARDANRSAE